MQNISSLIVINGVYFIHDTDPEAYLFMVKKQAAMF